jgi:hypothetical protein
MPFEPGKSGNPGGRPAVKLDDGRSLADLAKEHTAAAVATLAEIVGDKKVDPRARVSAATALLDRGWGRPQQSVDLTSAGHALGLVPQDDQTLALEIYKLFSTYPAPAMIEGKVSEAGKEDQITLASDLA